MGRNTSGVMSVALSVLALVLMPVGLASAFAVDPNLVGHWKVDGDAHDNAGNNHGTLIGENGQAPNRYWNGLIDDVRIYNRSLTAEEIGALAESEPAAPPPPPPAPHVVTATGHDSRIDLRWPFDTDPSLEGYNIYRADSAAGPFTKLNDSVHKASVHSDFFGVNDQTYYYYVKSVAIRGGGESEPSNTVSATSYAMTDEQLLTSLQEAVL